MLFQRELERRNGPEEAQDAPPREEENRDTGITWGMGKTASYYRDLISLEGEKEEL